MKSLRSCVVIFCICLSVVQGDYPTDERSVRKLADKWRKQYDVIYKSQDQAEEKYQIFRDNVKYINELNKIYSGQTEFTLNKFADMSPEEFQKRVLMPKRQPPLFEESRYIKSTSVRYGDLPDKFDWSEQGRVTPVKDQGDVGTCWAFSTVENIEGQWIQFGQKMLNLSVEQVVECDSTADIQHNNTHADCGIFGGWPYLAYQYVMRAGGLQTWEDYWYCSGLGGKPGTCEICPPGGYNWTRCGPPVPYCNMTQSCAAKLNTQKFVPRLKVIDWKAIGQNETEIAEQLMSIGPLSIALDATMLQFYHRGVFDPLFCSKTNLDHAVLLVGFGTDKGLFSTKPYWKVKNSWGASWGEDGYFRMLRGSGTCGMNTAVTTSVLQKP